jgi:hypothetical protein
MDWKIVAIHRNRVTIISNTPLFVAHRPSNQVESDQDNFQPIVERLSGNSGDRTITELSGRDRRQAL